MKDDLIHIKVRKKSMAFHMTKIKIISTNVFNINIFKPVLPKVLSEAQYPLPRRKGIVLYIALSFHNVNH